MISHNEAESGRLAGQSHHLLSIHDDDDGDDDGEDDGDDNDDDGRRRRQIWLIAQCSYNTSSAQFFTLLSIPGDLDRNKQPTSQVCSCVRQS